MKMDINKDGYISLKTTYNYCNYPSLRMRRGLIKLIGKKLGKYMKGGTWRFLEGI